VLLSAPAEIILERIATRTNNHYGKSPEERALVLHHLEVVEPLLRAGATLEIDASAPIDEVVRQLEELASRSQ
jgi:thymidylate kinase